MRQIDHFIDGNAVGGAGRFGDVYNPNTGEIQARVPFADAALIDKAASCAAQAQTGWAAINPQRRARVMFEFKRLIEARMDELAVALGLLLEFGPGSRVRRDGIGHEVQRDILVQLLVMGEPDDANALDGRNFF